jgi:hypothetical protein
MAIEDLEKRFGTLAVQKGFITADQLFEAIEIQVKEDMEAGKHRLIGTILFEHGFITVLQIDTVLKSMGKESKSVL